MWWPCLTGFHAQHSHAIEALCSLVECRCLDSEGQTCTVHMQLASVGLYVSDSRSRVAQQCHSGAAVSVDAEYRHGCVSTGTSGDAGRVRERRRTREREDGQETLMAVLQAGAVCVAQIRAICTQVATQPIVVAKRMLITH